MTTPEQVKLREQGTSLHMIVQSADLVPVGKYPEYAFVGTIDNGRVVDLRVPKVSAERQLTRAALKPGDTVGCTLRFSRDANPADAAKPFWGISIVRGRDASGAENGAGVATPAKAAAHTTTANPPTPTPPPDAPAATKKEKRSALYKAMTSFVLETILPMYREKKIEPNANDIHAMVSVLYIAETRN